MIKCNLTAGFYSRGSCATSFTSLMTDTVALLM